jgi:hypothetical protein
MATFCRIYFENANLIFNILLELLKTIAGILHFLIKIIPPPLYVNMANYMFSKRQASGEFSKKKHANGEYINIDSLNTQTIQ